MAKKPAPAPTPAPKKSDTVSHAYDFRTRNNLTGKKPAKGKAC
jgi:hypothetical protein